MYCNVGKHVCGWSGTWSWWRQDDQQNTKAIYMSQWLLPSPLSKPEGSFFSTTFFPLIKRFSSSHACGGWWPIWLHVRMIQTILLMGPYCPSITVANNTIQVPLKWTVQNPDQSELTNAVCPSFPLHLSLFISQIRTIIKWFFKSQDWLGLMPRGTDLEALVLSPTRSPSGVDVLDRQLSLDLWIDRYMMEHINAVNEIGRQWN